MVMASANSSGTVKGRKYISGRQTCDIKTFILFNTLVKQIDAALMQYTGVHYKTPQLIAPVNCFCYVSVAVV